MHRIDADGHVGNLFSNGDKSLGIKGTRVDAAWLNAVQEEICNLLAARGVTLAKGTNTQLRDSMKAAAAAWGAINGTSILDSVGVTSVARSGLYLLVVTLSKAMASANYSVVISSDFHMVQGGMHQYGFPIVVAKTTTTFSIAYVGSDLHTQMDINSSFFSGPIDFAVFGDWA